jgi:hypothetical protein
VILYAGLVMVLDMTNVFFVTSINLISIKVNVWDNAQKRLLSKIYNRWQDGVSLSTRPYVLSNVHMDILVILQRRLVFNAMLIVKLATQVLLQVVSLVIRSNTYIMASVYLLVLLHIISVIIQTILAMKWAKLSF